MSTQTKINMEKPVAFNATGEVKISTTSELAKMINEVFSQVFKDYYGCLLTCQFQPERGSYIVVPKLYFHVLKKEEYEDGLFAFKPLSAQPQDDIVGRVQRLSTISTATGVKVAITDEGKSVLEDFIITPAIRQQKFDWNTAYDTSATDTETFVYVFKLDINKFLTKIFGDKDENGAPLYYQINPTCLLGAVNQYKKPDNWGLNILRLNHTNEAAAAELLGMAVPTNNPGPVIITDGTVAR